MSVFFGVFDSGSVISVSLKGPDFSAISANCFEQHRFSQAERLLRVRVAKIGDVYSPQNTWRFRTKERWIYSQTWCTDLLPRAFPA